METTIPLARFRRFRCPPVRRFCACSTLFAMALLFLFVTSPLGADDRIPAFPGAEGYGKYTTGGTRLAPEVTRPVPITVHKVTNLNDGGPGSLRAAVNASGPRVVIFEVSGTIRLRSSLVISNAMITIAGQTAPGDGICITGHPVIIDAGNVVLRFLRIRLGDEFDVEADSLEILPGRGNIIIDHCSFSFGIDETFSAYAVRNVTVQWCIISESLFESIHDKGTHGYGSILGGEGMSFHHNLYAHHSSRTPRFNGGRAGTAGTELVDFRNNVIYNWGFNGAHGGEVRAKINIVNNYYKAGPATSTDQRLYRIVEPTSDRLMSGEILYDEDGLPYHTSQWFVDGNYVYGFPDVTSDNWAGGVQGAYADDPEIRVHEPFAVEYPLPEYSAEEAFERVMRYAGATLPRRDAIDRRIIWETRTGTATYGASFGAGTGIIDTPSDVGGLPELRSAEAPLDSDGDGIPDWWEIANGLDPHDPSDAHRVDDPSGYTNLELYLNELAAAAMPRKETGVYEGFDTQPGGLAGVSGETSAGWGAPWTANSSHEIIEDGLSWPGLPTSPGALKLGSDDSDGAFDTLYRMLDAPYRGSGSMWASVLVEPSVLTTSAIGGFLQVVFGDGAQSNSIYMGVQWGGQHWQAGGSLVIPSVDGRVTSNVTAAAGETAFLVLNLDFETNIGTFWVNPEAGVEHPGEPVGKFTFDELLTVDRVGVAFHNWGSGIFSGSVIDEIRVGTSYAFVSGDFAYGPQWLPNAVDRIVRGAYPMSPSHLDGSGYSWPGSWSGHWHPDFGEFVRPPEADWIFSLSERTWYYPLSVVPGEFYFYEPAADAWHWSADGLGGFFWSQANAEWGEINRLNVSEADVRPPVAEDGGPIGYASLPRRGVESLTGGKGGPVVYVETLAELAHYAGLDDPHIIVLDADLEGASTVQVRSNTTLLGRSGGSTLTGIGLQMNNFAHNIIVRNLRINRVADPVNDGDAIQIRGGAHSIWVDHCELFNEDPLDQPDSEKYDSLLDVTNGAGYVTVSWTHFHSQYRMMLLGSGDSLGSRDDLRIRVTIHNCIYENPLPDSGPVHRGGSRTPSLRFGKAHVFNTLYRHLSEGPNSRNEADIRFENNVLEHVNRSWRDTAGGGFGRGYFDFGGADFGENRLINTTARTDILERSFGPPYEYEHALLPVDDLVGILRERVGATLDDPFDGLP
ncbi:MAG: hypothetical protein JJU00_00190 [Opitutales bacterium]|nr:hypothetical protein [Opitutales bacterium]